MTNENLAIDGISLTSEKTPASAQEISEVLREAYRRRAATIPVGGGTKLHIGNIPRAAQLALRTCKLRGVVEYEPDNLTVSVQAGTPLQELQDTLRQENQFLPLDPPFPEYATVGGLVACNTSGSIRFRYGTIRDFLLGVKIVHPDGAQTKAGGKLVKNVTGYDMCKLYTGSLGTLGILTELTFKAYPRSEALATVVITYPSLEAALRATQVFLESHLQPDAMEAWNENAFASLGRNIKAAQWQLILRLGEVEAAVVWQLDRLREIVPAGRGEIQSILGTEESERFWHQAASAREKGNAQKVALIRCAVLYQSTAQAARLMEEMGRRLEAKTALFCHAGNYIIYGRYEWDNELSSAEELRREITLLREYCREQGGHAVVEKVWPEAKQNFDVWGYQEPALEIMKRIKKEFDPRDLLNPGRFVGRI